MRTLHINLYGLDSSERRMFASRLLDALDNGATSSVLVGEEPTATLPGEEAGRHVVACTEQYRRQALLEGRVDVVLAECALPQRLLTAPVSLRHALGALMRELTSPWQQLHVRLLEKPELLERQEEQARQLGTLVREWGRQDCLSVNADDNGVRWVLLSARAMIREAGALTAQA